MPDADQTAEANLTPVADPAPPEKRKRGRPRKNPADAPATPDSPAVESHLFASKYKSEYCQRMVEYFSQPNTREVDVTITTRTGGTLVKKERQAEPPRHISAFARSIGVTTHAVRLWKDKYPEFATAYETAKELIKEQIIDCGVLGLWNPQFTKLYAVNETDMRDKTAVDVTSEGRALAPTITVVPPTDPAEPTPAPPQVEGGE